MPEPVKLPPLIAAHGFTTLGRIITTSHGYGTELTEAQAAEVLRKVEDYDHAKALAFFNGYLAALAKERHIVREAYIHGSEFMEDFDALRREARADCDAIAKASNPEAQSTPSEAEK